MITDTVFKDGFGALVAALPTYGSDAVNLTERMTVYQRVLSPLMGDLAFRGAVHRTLVGSPKFPAISDLIEEAERIVGTMRGLGSVLPYPSQVAKARLWHAGINDDNFFQVESLRERALVSWGEAADEVCGKLLVEGDRG